MSASISPTRSGRTSLCTAAIGAVVSFVALIGFAAVVDGPHHLGEVSIPSETIRLTEVDMVYEPAGQFHAVAPGTGHYEDPGLQVNYEVHA